MLLFYFGLSAVATKTKTNTKFLKSVIITITFSFKMSSTEQRTIKKQCVICNIPGVEGYFNIPDEPKRRLEWLKSCPKLNSIISKEGKIPKSKRVCFRHFDLTSDIKTTSNRYILFPSKSLNLEKNGVKLI